MIDDALDERLLGADHGQGDLFLFDEGDQSVEVVDVDRHVDAVGGGAGGYYTQAQYRQLVAYARRHSITVVPEIDMPGHSTAALSSYPGLVCEGKAPAVYTGIGVTANALCVKKASTYSFLEDVLREVAALTPGPYIHIGGDEAAALPDADRSIVAHLFRDSREVELDPLHGGFSEATVWRAVSRDALGQQHAPAVVKLGPNR